MKKTTKVACMVATLIVFAAAMLTGCEKDENDFARDRVSGTSLTTTITDTMVVHDTTRVVVADTVIVHDTVHQTDTIRVSELDTVIIHDTIFRPDTVIIGGDTVIRWDTIVSHDTTVVDRLRTTATRHLSWDGVTLNGSQLWLAGTDRLVVSVVENGVTVQNDSTTYHHRSRFSYSGISGNTFPSSVNGNTYRLVGGTVVVGGNTITTSWVGDEIVESSVVIRGTNYRGVLHACHGTAIYWQFSNGTATCHFEDAYGNAAGNYSTPYNTDTPTRRLISADTTYQHISTNPTGVWSTVSSTLTWSCSNRRTITRHYNMAPVTETDNYDFSISFPYAVSVSGSAQTSMLGTTVNINSGVANFGGGFTVTFTAQPRTCVLSPIPLPCQHQLLTATLTSNGVVVNGTLEGTATTGTVPVSILPPTPPIFDGALWAMVTDSYTTNLSTTPEKWVHVIRQHGTGSTATYTWYYTQWRSGLSRADFDSVSVTASQITSLQSAITAGRALAKVYHHSDGGATFELGTVKGIQQSSGRWKVKYYDISGNFENQIEFSASTFSSYYGEDPIRGIMTASGQLTADGITMQVF